MQKFLFISGVLLIAWGLLCPFFLIECHTSIFELNANRWQLESKRGADKYYHQLLYFLVGHQFKIAAVGCGLLVIWVIGVRLRLF